MNNAIIADANLFSHAFDLLTLKMDEGTKNRNLQDAALLVPATVNGALACELYMKALLESTVKSHKLDELYELLEPGIQSCVSTIMIDMGKSKDVSYDKTKFKTELGNYGGCFVEWRYFYESEPKININFIKNLLAVLKGTVSAKMQGVDFSDVDFGSLLIS